MTRLASVCLLLALSGCQCGLPSSPTPVTLRIKNTLNVPIYVDASKAFGSIRIERKVNADWIAFVESPPCECLACDQICGGCSCPNDGVTNQVVKIVPGASREREWNGIVQLSNRGPCFSSPACLEPQNPPVNETFRARMCYALSVPSAMETDAGTPVPGSLPAVGTVCTTREFQIQDGAVELTPVVGQGCSSHAQCPISGQLCFDGTCTSACPANDFPPLGPGWQVRIPEPDNEGLFDVIQEGEATVYRAQAIVSSVTYQNETMTVHLSRAAMGPGKATLYVILPRGWAVPLRQNERVNVTVMDSSTTQNYENRAVVIRDESGALLLAADTAQNGVLLPSTLTTPFEVSAGEDVVGCLQSECGKQLFRSTRFNSTAGPLELKPGKSAEQVVGQATFKVLNVAHGGYDNTTCSLKSLAPYLIANVRADGP